MIPSDLSFGYLSAELKSPVKTPIPSLSREQEELRQERSRLGNSLAKLRLGGQVTEDKQLLTLSFDF